MTSWVKDVGVHRPLHSWSFPPALRITPFAPRPELDLAEALATAGDEPSRPAGAEQPA